MEEMEEVPWSELVARARPTVPRPALIAVAVGALIVAAFAGSRLLAPAPAAPEVLAPAQPAPGDAIPVADTATTTPPATDLPPAVPAVLSEADLRAVPVEGALRAAAARAEWFVTDFFTADHDPVLADDLRNSLPYGGGTLAQEGDSPSISYVEWARATEVEPAGPDSYVATVVYRAIGKTADGPYRRLPVRAVTVPVHVEPDGATMVTDFPAPTPLPTAVVPNLGIGPDEPAPDHIVQAAAGRVVGFTGPPKLAVSSRIDGGWRLVFVVVDEVGLQWPLAIRVDEMGDPMP